MTELKYLKNVATLKLNSEACTGCGRCMQVCPHGVFKKKDGKAVIANKDACMECGACARNCAFQAVTVEAGVGCASAIIVGALTGTEPCCGSSDGSSGSSCCG